LRYEKLALHFFVELLFCYVVATVTSFVPATTRRAGFWVFLVKKKGVLAFYLLLPEVLVEQCDLASAYGLH
jgi:hypothetical protein